MFRSPLLKDRVFRSSNFSKPLPSSLRGREDGHLSGTHKLWTQEQMYGAINSVLQEGMSIRRAADQYGVPKSSLGDRLSGRVLPDARCGPDTYLSLREEDELVMFLTRCASIGYAKSRKEVLALVQAVLDSRGIHRTITNGWWESFRHRHPNLTLRTAVSLSIARAKATDPEMLGHYFDLLEQTLHDNLLEGKPGQLFNMDETGMPLDTKPPKVVATRGGTVSAIGSGDKTQITVVACVNAVGYCIPPMVIWDRKLLAPELTVGEVPGTIYGLSHNGWMDMELFNMWFSNHFLRYAPAARPLLLLLDGHSSHYCPDTVRLAAKEQVILFTLPPNTTHLTQPLDKGCFGPLKAAWREVCHQFTTTNPGKVVTRFQFSRLFNKAWMQSMTVGNITAGFRVTGVHPINRDIFAQIEESPLVKQSGLAFIPFYSSSPRRNYRERIPDMRIQTTDDSDGSPTQLVTDHPDSPAANPVWLQSPQTTAVSKYLQYPSPFTQQIKYHSKSCGRVLTSAENLALIADKEKAKNEKERLKAERKKLKEEKKLHIGNLKGITCCCRKYYITCR